MNGRSQTDYVSLMKDIVQLAWESAQIQLTPNFITSDYERALRNALNEVFGAAEHYGCITHFLRAVNRSCTQEAKSKLSNMRQTDVSSTHYFHGNHVGKLRADEVRKFFELTKALPYLPPERIVETYHTLYAQLTETAAGVLMDCDQYFRRIWLACTSCASWVSPYDSLQATRRMSGPHSGGRGELTTSLSR